MARRSKKADQDLLVKIRKRYKLMYDADDENRQEAMEDMKFVNVPGEQWEENMKKERGKRPCYEFNKLRVNGKRVINEIRANRPQGKVRGVEGSDKKTAEIYDGLIRNILTVSDFETIQDYAAEYQVNAGMAAWRVVTEYRSDSVFDQDIYVEPIKNPFCLYCDPAAQDVLKRDAYDWLLTEKISKREYESKYPKAEPVDFEIDDEFDSEDDDWEDEEYVRVAEYWWKEPVKREICQLKDGSVIEKDSDEYAAIIAQDPSLIVRSRVIDSHKIMMCIVSGNAVLEQPMEQAGREHRFVMVYGEYIVIDGKTYWFGLPRFAKDAQRSYNISRTAISETIALAPQAKIWLTVDQGKGLTDQLAEVHKKNFPVAYYNHDPKAPGPPQRVGGADVPVALIQETQIASQEIRDVTGLHEASFGEESNETSGVALARKQRQGALVTFNFPDNMAKGTQRTYEIIIDLIPHIFDTERELRVLGSDGAEDYVKVNQFVQDEVTGEQIKINDLAQGDFDVTVTVGPSFSTLREEAAEIYSEMASSNPVLYQVAGDLIARSMDLPYSEDIADRLQAMLPPQIQKMISEGKDIPPEAQAVLDQAEMLMQQVQEHGQLVQQASQELEEEKAVADKTKAEIRSAIADLKRQQAEFRATVAEQMAELRIRESELKETEQDVQERQEIQASIQAANDAIQAMDEMTAQFIDAAAGAMDDLNSRTTSIDEVVRKPKPNLKGVKTERKDGQLISVIEFDDGSVKKLAAKRENGNMTAVPID